MARATSRGRLSFRSVGAPITSLLKVWLAVPLLAGGALVLALSLFWLEISPPGSNWTREKSEALNQIDQQINAYQLKFKAAEDRGVEVGDFPPAYYKLIERRDRYHQLLIDAQEQPKVIAQRLRYTGVAMLMFGLAASRFGAVPRNHGEAGLEEATPSSPSAGAQDR